MKINWSRYIGNRLVESGQTEYVNNDLDYSIELLVKEHPEWDGRDKIVVRLAHGEKEEFPAALFFEDAE